MICKIFRLILSMPKTIYYNFKYLKLKEAIKMPLLVAYDCRIRGRKNSILVNDNNGFFSIRLGFSKGSYNISEGKKTYFEINDQSTIRFNGDAIISKGSYICSNKNAYIIFGKGFSCNANCIISAQNLIEFGDNCLLGWNCTIIDGDGHSVNHSSIDKKTKIIIGNHVWITANATILKGSIIKMGSIVGFGAIVTDKFDKENILLVSEKAKIRKENVSWEK